MKILLVSANREREPYPVAPLGAAYIAAAARSRGHDVRILDLCFADDEGRAVEDLLKSFSPEVVGITIRNIDNLTYGKSVFYLPGIKRLVELIKARVSVPLVAGGSGFSIFPEEVLRYLGLDMGIAGEGETAFISLLDALHRGGDVADIPNLCCIEKGEFRPGKRVYEEGIAGPDRSLLDNRIYLELGGTANIQSKRGCPFACTYCTYPGIEGRRIRLREPGAVVEEMLAMKTDYGLDYFFFVDDIFNVPAAHAAGICEEMLRKDLAVSWACFATPMGMTSELAALMKRAGCRGVEFGSDAGSERTLRGLGKGFTPDDISAAAERCRNVDLPNAHYIIIGGPGEDVCSLRETFSLFDKIDPTAVIALTGVRIYPNTQLHEKAVADAVIEKDLDLLEPVFYLSPALDADTMNKEISGHAKQRRNWIVPALDIRCDAAMLSLLRKKGRRGPLWDIL